MTIEEINEILVDKSMQKCQTNFKILNNDGNGGTGRITVAKVFESLEKLYKQFNAFVDQQQKFNDSQQEFNKLIIKRLDNLVKKNNLKE